MFTIQDLFNHHEKAIKVVLSCKNVEHIECARRFCINLLEVHTRSALGGPFHRREVYIRRIEESENLMNEALSDTSYRLKGEVKTKYDFKSKKGNKKGNKKQ
jgi:hypothetical protein